MYTKFATSALRIRLKRMNSELFYFCGLSLSKTARHRNYPIQRTGFRALLGTSPHICSILRSHLEDLIVKKETPVHLQWTLHFLKCYNISPLNRPFLGRMKKPSISGFGIYCGVQHRWKL